MSQLFQFRVGQRLILEPGGHVVIVRKRLIDSLGKVYRVHYRNGKPAGDVPEARLRALDSKPR